jgi:hypothetical protein
MKPPAAILSLTMKVSDVSLRVPPGRLDRASATTRIDIIHPIRISTDREINVAVKPERLCLRDDRHF